MEDLIVGEEQLTISNVASTIEQSVSFAELLKRWGIFVEYLVGDDVAILELDSKCKLGTIQLREIPREALKIWKASKGSQATLKVLYDALLKCGSGLLEIAEALRTKFFLLKSGTYLIVSVQGQLQNLEKLFGESIAQRVAQRLKTRPEGKLELLNSAFLAFHQLQYYINRTFVYKAEVERKIFSHVMTNENIFLVKGISKPELARISNYKPIDVSGKQLHEVNVKHIILESDDDFDQICKKTYLPVHIIEYKKDRFFWVKSSKNVNIIENFLKSEGQSLTEDEVIIKIMDPSPPSVLTISDAPGSGKTEALHYLAKRIKELHASVVVLFISIQEFLPFLLQVYSVSSAASAIASFSASSNVAKIIIKAMLLESEKRVVLIFDGYDIPFSEDLSMFNMFLTHAKELRNTKLIVSTRNYSNTRLQRNVHQLPFQILPFQHSDKIEFLTKYWTTVHNTKMGYALEQFAEKCLDTLKTRTADKGYLFFGIPLRCKILGDAQATTARRISNLDNNYIADISEKSTYDMYTKIVDLKLKSVFAISEVTRKRQKGRLFGLSPVDKCIHAHVYHAVKILYPNWLPKFKLHLRAGKTVEESTVFSVGLLAKVQKSESPKFEHQTFAEYILANYLIDNLKKIPVCGELLFIEILGNDGTDLMESCHWRPHVFNIKNPVICYFANMYLKDITKYSFADVKLSSEINYTHICDALLASCCNDFENLFKVAAINLCRIHQSTTFKKLIFRSKSSSREKDLNGRLKYLLHLAVENSNSLSLVQEAFELVQNLPATDTSVPVFHGDRGTPYPWISGCTPLHVAVYLGKYNILTYLLDKYKSAKVLKLDDLLNTCVYYSTMNDTSVVEEKIAIVDFLLHLNPTWVNMANSPLLEPNVHPALLKSLIKNGFNINSYNCEVGTLLHTAGDADTYETIVRWAISKGFNLINAKNFYGVTPMMSAIMRFGSLSCDLTELFHEAGANFNEQDCLGDSILFHVLAKSNDTEFILMVVDNVDDINHENIAGENAAHAIIGSASDEEHVLNKLMILHARNFSKFDSKDCHGKTPLMEAVTKFQGKDILDFFVKVGANVNSCDE